MNIQKENHILPFLWMRGEDEAVLREEMAKIAECGIGAVCLEARPHPDFAGPRWWHDVDIVLDEAKARGMKVWILDDAHFPTGYANGLLAKYPARRKLYLRYNTCDVTGGLGETAIPVRQMLRPRTTWLDMGKPPQPERDNNRPVAVVAYRLVQGNAVDEDSAVDLIGMLKNGYARCTLPQGMWRVFVVYATRADGGREDYINPIDAASVQTLIEAVYQPHYQRYADEFGKTIAGFFSDEPGFGNTMGFAMDEAIGHRDMALPWSGEMPGLLAGTLGPSWELRLHFLWAPGAQNCVCPDTRQRYMDLITCLYAQNFSGQLGGWCEAHGVEYIGHVIEDEGQHSRLGCGAGHYFRAMAGQHMAGIDIIGNQMKPGADGLTQQGFTSTDNDYYLYALPKLAASSAHLDPVKKGRALVELFGAYGWQFGVRDMKWVLDRLLAQGINTLVPHAFSMADYPDTDCPPHFYARGNNPQFRFFAQLMRYANRACDLLAEGTHVAAAAVLYTAEEEWLGDAMPIQQAAKVLLNHQLDFDFLPQDLLANGGAVVQGKTLVANGVSFGALVVPRCEALTPQAAEFIASCGGLPVIFLDALPLRVAGQGPEELDKLANATVVPLEKLPAALEKLGLRDVTLEREFKDILAYHLRRQDGDVYLLHNASLYQTWNGQIHFAAEGDFVLHDAMCEGESWQLAPLHLGDEGNAFLLQLEPRQTVFVMSGQSDSEYYPIEDRLPECTRELDLSTGWKVSAARAIDYPNFGPQRKLRQLIPYSDIDAKFSGILRYEKTFELDKAAPRAYLSFGEVHEALQLWVNGKDAGCFLAPPYRYVLKDLLKAGKNTLVAEVATTAYRETLSLPEPPFRYVFEPLEATGLAGEIVLSY